MANTSELLERFVTLFNENRIDEGEHDYAPHGYAEEVGTGRRMTPAENSANAKAWRAAFPDANGTITCKVVDGNRGAAEILWRGTNTGSLMGRPATGQAVTLRAMVLIETDGSKVLRSAHYIDVAGMMAQLGGGAGV
jgi:steroid delta-isomerase-like uncharacterized protein